MKSIYKTDRGQKAMERWYEHFLGRLEVRLRPLIARFEEFFGSETQ